MVVKVYVSGISGNKEVKKRQQRVLMILDSRIIKYEVVDIAEPGNEDQKDFMQNNSTSLGATVSDTNPRHPLPPQIFSDDTYCGDYDQFDMANEIDELEKFLKITSGDTTALAISNAEIKFGNGNVETEVKASENEDVIKAFENDTSTENKGEDFPETESKSLEKSNEDAKIENGRDENQSITTEQP